MKAWFSTGVSALLAFGIAPGHAIALDAGTGTATSPAHAAQTQRLYRGSKIIGATVRDPHDKKIGEIKDIMLDSRRGEIAYAVVNFGGVMGVGSKYHAIPWQALTPGDDGRYYVLQADREIISQAPGFDRGRWPDMSDQRWSAEVDRYWSRMVGHGSADANRLPPSGSPGAGSR